MGGRDGLAELILLCQVHLENILDVVVKVPRPLGSLPIGRADAERLCIEQDYLRCQEEMCSLVEEMKSDEVAV